MKDVVLRVGAGQIGLAIARRVGAGKKIVIGDKKLENAADIAKILTEAGFEALPMETDLSSPASIREIIAVARAHGEISMLVNAAGVSPSQRPLRRSCGWIFMVQPYCWKKWARSSGRAAQA